MLRTTTPAPATPIASVAPAGPGRLGAIAVLGMLLAVLAGCGGGSEPPIGVFPGRGELRGAEPLTTLSLQTMAEAAAIPGTRVSGVTPRYGVQAWRITYLTLDGAARPIVASGLMALPIKPPGATSPVLSYQHGTIFKNAEAPSNALAPTEPPLVLASLGYVVLAADYVGYGASHGAPHPYLLSQPTAAAVTDLLTAARLWRQAQGWSSNGQLFLVGYSEGGYATAAALRELEQGFSPHRPQLVAAVAGGGPQDVGTTLDRALERVEDQNRLLAALINPGFLRHLGNTVREEVRRAMLRELLPDDGDVSFQSTFLDFFLADDVGAIVQHCNVLDFRSSVPYRLFHGRDDRTVTYLSSVNALSASLAAGTSPALVNLTDCARSPSDHLPCVPEFFTRTVAYLGELARDL